GQHRLVTGLSTQEWVYLGLLCGAGVSCTPAFCLYGHPERSMEVAAKMKTHRGAAKRFRVTRTGKVLRNSGWKRHLLGKKSSARKRRISGTKVVQGNDRERVLRMLGKR